MKEVKEGTVVQRWAEHALVVWEESSGNVKFKGDLKEGDLVKLGFDKENVLVKIWKEDWKDE